MTKRAVVPSGIGNSISVPIPLAAEGSPRATVASFSRIVACSSRNNSPRSGCTQRTAPTLSAGVEDRCVHSLTGLTAWPIAEKHHNRANAATHNEPIICFIWWDDLNKITSLFSILSFKHNLFHRIHQRCESLDPHLQPVAALNGADAARCAGKNHVTGQQRHVRRDKTDQFGGLEDELLRVRVLPQLAVLEKLDGQFMRVNFRFHVGTERCERVERFAPRPLAFGILDGAVADVLGGGVTEDVA